MISTKSAPLPTTDPQQGRVWRFVERTGNKLPHPVLLFLGLLLIVGIASTVLALLGVSVTVPGTGELLNVRGLFTGEGIEWILTNAVTNFTGFPPLGTVLLMVMAVGTAERSGFLRAGVQTTIGRAPRSLLPYVVALVSLQGHFMGDVVFLVIPPLAAAVFRSAGRNPVAGLIGSFACVAAGYASGFTVGSLDALYSGITVKAAAILPGSDGLPTHILINYFFTATSSLALAVVGGFLIARVLEPRLPVPEIVDEEQAETDLTPKQRRALVAAAAVGIVLVSAAFVTWLVPGSPLRGENGTLIPSPFLSSIPPMLFVAFLLPAIVYGFLAGTFHTIDDVPRSMGESLKDMSSYIVLMFFVAQMIATFTWSNLGILLSVTIASGLERLGLTGFLGVLLFIALICVLNLFIASGSAMWSLVAPVFVPTFMLLGLQPALTLAAFRIGDSTTALITPMNVYLFLVLAMLQKYEPSAKYGTLVSRTGIFLLPFIIIWTAVLGVFYFLDLPLGPGAGIHLS
ncbi:AbgT family transporter [Rhodococcus wratislaviensis]|uniref:Aminobenzoyl-glutamate transport protein n=1 Tax=Rhodococcus wratislaviensis NBRC 100605 TaxID=1219028 RepID=X0RBB3_RHOWR|nr:AbgT family transporter [Rhodococcus wratislaviensis]GAF48310.1 aminobenzoyl-glutamate transport protein [Rhodococcus wratislaviensis NBRC 100605]